MPSTITVRPNYKPHQKQMLLHNAPVSYEDLWIILYGGARGSGKSAGALADAFMFAQTYPGAKIGIFRESLDAVKQSFLDKLPNLFPQYAQGVQLYDYKEKSSSWYPSRSIVFPNGSYITLQRVASYAEAREKQGWEFHYLIVDEVTKHEERTIDYMLTMVRSATVMNKYTGKPIKIPTKVVFGCNPGGIGHTWVKERFIDPTVIKYDEHFTPTQTKDKVEEVISPKDNHVIKRYVRFIPASYKDNPFLNESYVANLMALPEHQKQMDMYGNWNVVAGKVFDLKEEQRLEDRFVQRDLNGLEGHYEVYISIDWGFQPSYHSALWHAVFPDKRIVTFKEMYGQKLVFEDFVKEIAKESEGMEIVATCLPHDMFRQGDRYRDEKGRVIGETKSDVFEAAGLSPISVESGKGKVQMRYDKIHSAMNLVNSDGVYKFRISKSCENLIDELDKAVYDDVDPTQLARASKDHALDAYGLFLIYYSDDIEPLGIESIYMQPKKSYLQMLLEEDERQLEEQEEEEMQMSVDNMFDL
jgi:phage terminase large subunit